MVKPTLWPLRMVTFHQTTNIELAKYDKVPTGVKKSSSYDDDAPLCELRAGAA